MLLAVGIMMLLADRLLGSAFARPNRDWRSSYRLIAWATCAVGGLVLVVGLLGLL
jgi:hypothetical protein